MRAIAVCSLIVLCAAGLAAGADGTQNADQGWLQSLAAAADSQASQPATAEAPASWPRS